MSEISVQKAKRPKYIPQELPDKPEPKLVSAKGKVERLVVVLDYGDDLYAQTMKALADGNMPILDGGNAVLNWTGAEYVGVYVASDTRLGVSVVSFDGQKKPTGTGYRVTMASNNPT